MGPLRIEFAFLFLDFSQDVMLPYINSEWCQPNILSCRDDRIVGLGGWLFFSVLENLHMVKYQSLYQELNLPYLYEGNVLLPSVLSSLCTLILSKFTRLTLCSVLHKANVIVF